MQEYWSSHVWKWKTDTCKNALAIDMNLKIINVIGYFLFLIQLCFIKDQQATCISPDFIVSEHH